ncbi:MAG: hypothetical protein JW976_06985 [Syntrophaceae bacterium]|nr:hypothetical protein [Syntrophaceae bacterium]
MKKRKEEGDIVLTTIIKKFSFTMAAFILSGCTHMIMTDMDTYLQNQANFKGKQVVFVTDLKDLLKRYDMYHGKEVELTAPVSYFGDRKFWTWHLMLDDGDNKIRAYEREYRLYPDRYALYLLRVARSEKGNVTIRGKLEKNGIELNRLFYKNLAVNTNIKSNDIYYPRFNF